MSRVDTNGPKNIQRLITPYPRHAKVDRVLNNLEDDFFHDGIHALADVIGEEPAVAEEDGGEPSESSDDATSDYDEPDGLTAVADDCTTASVDVIESASTDILPLSDNQAHEVDRIHATVSGLESAIEGLRALGSLRSVQILQLELSKDGGCER